MSAKKKICISKFFSDVLDAPIKNPRNQWGGENENQVFLRAWIDEKNGDLVGINVTYLKNTKPIGYKNRVEHIESIMSGKVGYAVMCVNGAGASDDVRKIEDWNKNEVLPIKEIIYDDATGMTYARVGDPVPTVNVIPESGVKVLADLNRPVRKARRGVGSY